MLTSNMANGLAELSIAPAMNSRLIPPHARPALEARGIDIDNFTPLTKDEMMARLDWVKECDAYEVHGCS